MGGLHACLTLLLGLVECLPCRLYSCPSGLALRSDVLNSNQLPASSKACCEEAKAGTVDLVVRSAGYRDGNEAVFLLDGQELYSATSRGLTVLVLRRDSTGRAIETGDAVEVTKSFDTSTESGDRELSQFLGELPEKSIVAMAVKDSLSSVAFSDAAKAAMRSCGGTLVDKIGFRAAYALIGIKGGSALGEELLASGNGHAVVHAPVTAAQFEDRPLCPSVSPAPPVAGKLVEGNLVLREGCRYELWEGTAVASGLAGAWVVITGASNGLLMFNTLLMMLAPREGEEIKTGRYGGAYVIDAFLEGGKIIQYNTVSTAQADCKHVGTPDQAASEAACLAHLASFLTDVPSQSKNRIRVTFFQGFFWPGVPLLADAVEAETTWGTAEVALVVQISAWYTICNYIKYDGCTRQDLIDDSEAVVIDRFNSEMGVALSRLEKFCAADGRAGKRGCIVGTKSWSAAQGQLAETFNQFDDEITKSMEPKKTSLLRYLDFFTLGEGMPDQTIMGHGSQILHSWAWQIMLAGFCPASASDGGRLGHAVFSGDLCSARRSNLEECPNYKQFCSGFSSCNLWMCMNNLPCKLVPSQKQFHAAGGGIDRACRGSDIHDNSESNYDAHVNVATLENCKAICVYTPTCVGIEFNEAQSRCEVWRSTGGIQTTIEASGFSCFRYTTATTTQLEELIPVPVGYSTPVDVFSPLSEGEGTVVEELMQMTTGQATTRCTTAIPCQLANHVVKQNPLALELSTALVAARFGHAASMQAGLSRATRAVATNHLEEAAALLPSRHIDP
eukprot:CAMPEP_0197629024 /NCGR_PEP_ID=MMETSP1338-20131121/7060_1 /TAXON_ID=43686 ORGANISM="Pelagodinium beii, Strain RCC1491" /NCGR_SAMPLE_ID=MMETSP1338 /ASSEMBLY_ACC=CAM_ASM_000754 /LENGTH=786 /DNA_ID=CAMNT_0043200031 /DNA_START=68 /DNA_END=2429 /DNA_ORIENTATION=+